MTAEGIIFDIQKYAIHDGPGIRSTVFLKGCPLRCSWCHNPESWQAEPELMVRPVHCVRCGRCVEICPASAISLNHELPVTDAEKCTRCGACISACPSDARQIVGRRVSSDEVLKEIQKDLIFYETSSGGVTFSGGEPLKQPEFLEALLVGCRKLDIHTAVDTSCYADPAIVRKISEHSDMFLCDIKHIDSGKHKQFTGVENSLILENITLLAELGKNIIVRVPVIPGFNDDAETVEAIGVFVRRLNNIQQIDLLPYNSGGNAKAERLGRKSAVPLRKPVSQNSMESLAERLIKMGFLVKAGG